MTKCEHLQAALDAALAEGDDAAGEAILAAMGKIGCYTVQTDSGNQTPPVKK